MEIQRGANEGACLILRTQNGHTIDPGFLSQAQPGEVKKGPMFDAKIGLMGCSENVSQACPKQCMVRVTVRNIHMFSQGGVHIHLRRNVYPKVFRGPVVLVYLREEGVNER